MDETPRQPIAAASGRPERHDYEYERCGVCNVFMASEPLAGRRLSKVTERRTKLDWAMFVQNIAASYLDAKRITLVMDNLNTHTGIAVRGVYPGKGQGAVGSVRVRLHHPITHKSPIVKLASITGALDKDGNFLHAQPNRPGTRFAIVFSAQKAAALSNHAYSGDRDR